MVKLELYTKFQGVSFIWNHSPPLTVDTIWTIEPLHNAGTHIRGLSQGFVKGEKLSLYPDFFSWPEKLVRGHLNCKNW